MFSVKNKVVYFLTHTQQYNLKGHTATEEPDSEWFQWQTH